MPDFDPSTLPASTEEREQYKEALYALLKADYEKHGIEPVLALVAQTAAGLAYQSFSQQTSHRELQQVVGRLMSVVEKIGETTNG